MVALEEKTLAENGVIRSGSDFFCFLCAHRGDNATDWRSHIGDPRHAGALRQFQTFFASNSATERINCKACNSSVDHEAFADHATWHRIVPWHEIGDKHKIFFENRILRVPSAASYACLPCKVSFADWSRALLHAGESSHLEAVSFEPPVHDGFDPRSITYEFLVAEGFEPWGANSVKCHHCTRPNVQVTSAEEHASEARHVEAKKTFAAGFGRAEPSSSRSESIAPQSIYDKVFSHSSSRNKDNGPSKNRTFPDAFEERRSRPRDPATSDVRHSSVPPRVAPRRTAFKFNQWQPRRSDSNSSKKPRSFPVVPRDDHLYCTVCDVRVDGAAEVHERDESHLKTLEALGHGEIEPVDGWTYRCKCCDCKVPNLENVFRHIRGMKHRQILAGSRNEKTQPRGNTVSFKMNFPAANNCPATARFPQRDPLVRNAATFDIPAPPVLNFATPVNYPMPVLPPSLNYPPPLLFAPPIHVPPSAPNASGLAALTRSAWENLPRDYIVVQNSKDLFCRICDCVIYGHSNVDEHIKGRGHGAAVDEFCSNVQVRADNTYHCKKCRIDVPSRNDLYIHSVGHTAKKKSESSARGGEETTSPKEDPSSSSGETSSPTGATSSPKGETSSSKGETSSPKGETDGAVPPRTRNEHIVVLNRQDYCCKVCYALFLHDKTRIEDHLAGAKHAEALKLHAKARYREDGKYYCVYCRCTIPNFANVPLHVIGERHKRAIPGGGGAITALPSDWRELSRYFVGANGDDSYYCRVCNFAVFSRSEVAEHLATETHFRNLEIYGCSEIRTVNGKQFNCAWCKCVIPDPDNIYVHLSGKRHLDNVKSMRGVVPAEQPRPVVDNIEKREQTEARVSREAETKPREAPTAVREPEAAAENIERGDRAEASVTREAETEPRQEPAQSPSDDYERMIEMMMRSEAREPPEDVAPRDRDASANSDVPSPSNVRSLASSTLSLNEAGLRKQRTPRLVRDAATVAILEADLARVYDIAERARQAENSRRLLFLDDRFVHCLACKRRLAEAEDPRQHLASETHCSSLETMLEGEATFAATPEQFSDLRLARDYLEETSDEQIKCHACQIELDNAETEIADHIAEKTHGKKRDAQRARADSVLAVNETGHELDWYNVRSYVCALCASVLDSEIRFARHLESPEHRAIVIEARPGRPLFVDFCPDCCLLTYGHPTNHRDHARTPEHLGRSVLGNEATKLPTAAKHFLLLPDRSVDRYEKLFEERNVKRADSEASVVRDVEYCCGQDSTHVRVWAFETSPESADRKEIVEYEIYFDLEKLGDPENASKKVETSLLREPLMWQKDEIPKDETSFDRLTMRHLPTGARCVMLFGARSDLTVNKLYQYAMLKFPLVAKLMGFLRPWLRMSELFGPQRFTTIDVFFYVVLYLQSESLVPKICDLIDRNGGSHLKLGNKDSFTFGFYENPNQPNGDRGAGSALDADATMLRSETELRSSRRDLRQLLSGFFGYCAAFDYRRDVACPRTGGTIGKHEYTGNYTDVKLTQFHSPACIENPLNSENNLAAGVDKLYVKHFRDYCAESHLILEKTVNQS